MTPIALTIAGSDSGGGAGIQADLRTFAFHCVHGASAITCITAQNTIGVTRVLALDPEMVVAQIEAVMSDLAVQAVKTGMLLNQEIMEVVVAQVKQWGIAQLVVDPVMVSRTGAPLIDEQAIAYLQEALIPHALVVTPNRFEAQLLSGIEITTLEEMQQAAQKIWEKGAKNVLVKGGGLTGTLKGVDVWFDGKNWEILTTEKIDTKNTHGTGCTLAAAITANLALKKDLKTAITDAKDYVTTALKSALEIGQGTGPVGHFFPLKQS